VAKSLDSIKRGDVKSMIAELIAAELSCGTIKNAIAVIRGIFNQAIEGGIVEVKPAARIGRFTRAAHSNDKKGVALPSGGASVP
jgi:hypothetical protein